MWQGSEHAELVQKIYETKTSAAASQLQCVCGPSLVPLRVGVRRGVCSVIRLASGNTSLGKSANAQIGK